MENKCTKCGKETINLTRIPNPNFDGSKYLCPLCTKELIDTLNRRKEVNYADN